MKVRGRSGWGTQPSSDPVGDFREGKRRRSQRPDPERQRLRAALTGPGDLFTVLFPALPGESVCVWAGTGRAPWVAHPPSEPPSQHSS